MVQRYLRRGERGAQRPQRRRGDDGVAQAAMGDDEDPAIRAGGLVPDQHRLRPLRSLRNADPPQLEPRSPNAGPRRDLRGHCPPTFDRK
jgi:hypothetical protein